MPPRRLAGEVPDQKNPDRKLAGELESQVPERRLAGAGPLNVTKPRPLAGEATVIQLPTALSAPLATPAIAGKVGAKSFKFSAARKSKLYDNRNPLVGMRVMFTVSFYDTDSRQAVSPSSVKVNCANGDTTATVTMSENSGREGYYSGSFIPTVHGEWTARLTYGGTNELLDQIKFYVL